MARRQHLITYDLATKPVDPHYEVLQQSEHFGWSAYITVEGSTIAGSTLNRLPNTTLVGWYENRDAAWNAFRALCDAAGTRLNTYVTVEKMVIAATDGTLSYSDEH